MIRQLMQIWDGDRTIRSIAKPGVQAKAPVQEEEPDEYQKEYDDTEGGGIPELPPPPPDAVSDLVVTLHENILWVTDHMRDNAEGALRMPAEDWHKLPLPPDQRPR